MAVFNTIIEASELHSRHININDFVGKEFQVLNNQPYTVRQQLPSFVSAEDSGTNFLITYRSRTGNVGRLFPKFDNHGIPLMLAFNFPRARPRTPTRRSRTPPRRSRTPTRRSRTPPRRSRTPTRRSRTPSSSPRTPDHPPPSSSPRTPDHPPPNYENVETSSTYSTDSIGTPESSTYSTDSIGTPDPSE